MQRVREIEGEGQGKGQRERERDEEREKSSQVPLKAIDYASLDTSFLLHYLFFFMYSFVLASSWHHFLSCPGPYLILGDLVREGWQIDLDGHLVDWVTDWIMISYTIKSEEEMLEWWRSKNISDWLTPLLPENAWFEDLLKTRHVLCNIACVIVSFELKTWSELIEWTKYVAI